MSSLIARFRSNSVLTLRSDNRDRPTSCGHSNQTQTIKKKNVQCDLVSSQYDKMIFVLKNKLDVTVVWILVSAWKSYSSYLPG